MTGETSAPYRLLDKNNPKPLYAQLEEILREDIFARRYDDTGMIPSEAELGRIYGVSRMTARAVVTQLVNDGLVRRVQGKGTFLVGPKLSAQPLAYMGVREQLEKMGYHTFTKLHEFRTTEADQRLAEIFAIEVGDPLFFITRTRRIDETPISLHVSYVPRALCPTLTGDNLETVQLCTVLSQEYGLVADHVIETLESVEANARYAKLLGVDRGFPLLLLEDTHRTAAGKIFEFTRVYFRGDKIQLRLEFDR